jgi:predicted DNA-binding transcriptional regulator YafY
MSSTIGSTRIERLLIIDGALRKFAVPSYRTIIAELEDNGYAACKRTIQRDIKYMQADYGAPEVIARRCRAEDNNGRVEYGLHYKDADWRLNVDQITQQDLDAIQLARQLLLAYEGHPTTEDLQRTYDKLLNEVDARVQIHLQSDLSPVAFAPVIQQRICPDVWRNIMDAARHRKSIRIEYDKKTAWNPKGQKSRLVDPYYIINLGGVWYLIGTCGLNDLSIRQYDISRIHSARITQASFTIPPDFDIEKILKATFGRFIGDPNDLVTVTVRFSKTVAPLVHSRCFHALEERKTDRQGRTEVSFPVTPAGATAQWRFYHVRSWILSWGPDCEVLAPPELQELVHKDIENMLRISNGKKE